MDDVSVFHLYVVVAVTWQPPSGHHEKYVQADVTLQWCGNAVALVQLNPSTFVSVEKSPLNDRSQLLFHHGLC